VKTSSRLLEGSASASQTGHRLLSNYTLYTLISPLARLGSAQGEAASEAFLAVRG
jgi:hypothetical protein